jgi:hypothetical protein
METRSFQMQIRLYRARPAAELGREGGQRGERGETEGRQREERRERSEVELADDAVTPPPLPPQTRLYRACPAAELCPSLSAAQAGWTLGEERERERGRRMKGERESAWGGGAVGRRVVSQASAALAGWTRTLGDRDHDPG